MSSAVEVGLAGDRSEHGDALSRDLDAVTAQQVSGGFGHNRRLDPCLD